MKEMMQEIRIGRNQEHRIRRVLGNITAIATISAITRVAATDGLGLKEHGRELQVFCLARVVPAGPPATRTDQTPIKFRT